MFLVVLLVIMLVLQIIFVKLVNKSHVQNAPDHQIQNAQFANPVIIFIKSNVLQHVQQAILAILNYFFVRSVIVLAILVMAVYKINA